MDVKLLLSLQMLTEPSLDLMDQTLLQMRRLGSIKNALECYFFLTATLKLLIAFEFFNIEFMIYFVKNVDINFLSKIT